MKLYQMYYVYDLFNRLYNFEKGKPLKKLSPRDEIMLVQRAVHCGTCPECGHYELAHSLRMKKEGEIEHYKCCKCKKEWKAGYLDGRKHK